MPSLPSSLQAVSSIWTSTPPLRDYTFVAAGFVSAVFVFSCCFVFGCLAVGGGPPPPIPLLVGLIERRNKYLESRFWPGGPNTFATPPENLRDFDFSHNIKCNVTMLLLYLLYEANTTNTGFFIVCDGLCFETS